MESSNLGDKADALIAVKFQREKCWIETSFFSDDFLSFSSLNIYSKSCEVLGRKRVWLRLLFSDEFLSITSLQCSCAAL